VLAALVERTHQRLSGRARLRSMFRDHLLRRDDG
jgi:hypothetical protein